MKFVTKVVLLKSGELTSEGGIPSGESIFSGENDFGNVLDAALARRFFLRVSSGTSEGEGHVF